MRVTRCIAFFALTAMVACGDSGDPIGPDPGPTTTFQGTVAGSGGQTGTLSVTIQGQASTAASVQALFESLFVATLHAQTTVQATGTLRLVGGTSVALTGTYNPSTKVLSLSGGGFTLNATVNGALMTGTYTGPNGASGGLSTHSTAAGTVTAYCGTTSRGGVFNLAVASTGAVTGTFFVNEFGYITGQVTGSTITIQHGDASSTGTISGSSVSGTSTTGNTWSGSTSACQ